MKYGYKKVKQKFLWFRWAFVFIFPLLVLFTIFGEGGIIHNYVLSLKLGKLNEALTELDSQNLRTVFVRIGEGCFQKEWD